MERVFHGSYNDTTCIDWSADSRVVAVGSNDMTTRIYAFARFENLKEYIIGGNSDAIVNVFFEEKSLNINTVSRNGHVIYWECSVVPDELVPAKNKFEKKNSVSTEEEKEDEMIDIKEDIITVKEEEEKEPELYKFYYTRKFRIFIDKLLTQDSTEESSKKKKVLVTAAAYQKSSHIMVVGCASGEFLLLDMSDEGALLHSLQISSQTITSVSVSSTGDWVALGSSSLGQLLVWEWQSESYVLKQQGHYSDMRVVVYSSDGQHIATGGEDGKVKLWSAQSSFCFVTFSEHTGAVTGLTFTQSGRAVLSSSLDGTVRAFDLTRYRNFKTLTSPQPSQFSCVSVDSSGELVVAGGQDTHEIYLWSLKTGRLLEILVGHNGPVMSVQFSRQPGSSTLVSTGWDATVKIWDAILTTTAKETIGLASDGLYVTLRPDGNQVAVATLDGQISMFNTVTGHQEANIVGRNDLGAGRADADKVTAKTNLKSKAFTTLCYTPDGKYILAGGQSKNVCIYNVEEELLIKKFEITQNRSFDAMDDIISRRKMAEGGINLALVEEREDPSERASLKLPGVVKGDKSQRSFRPEVCVTSLTFSPTGQSWAACSSEGLLVYSLDNDWLFDPLYLDIANNPTAVRQKLKEKSYSTALMMAIRLNIDSLKKEVLESIPINYISVVVNELPETYVEGTLTFMSNILDKTSHLGLYTKWVTTLVMHHGNSLKRRAAEIHPVLTALERALSTHHLNLSKVCDRNEHFLSYLLAQVSLRSRQKIMKIDEKSDEGDIKDNKELNEEEGSLEAMFED
ncbi:periodic tryptophan protein 2 homolog isoform X2 [Oratosquilla oratoria]